MKFLYYLIPIVGAFVLISIYEFIIVEKKARKNISKKLTEANFQFKWFSKKPYDLLIEGKEDIKIYCKYIIVPSNSSITINSKDTWKLSWGGASANTGRAYPKSRYLPEIKAFANCNLNNCLKVFIIYKSTEHVNRYLNECELDIIDIKKSPYGYKVLNYLTMEEDLKSILDVVKK